MLLQAFRNLLTAARGSCSCEARAAVRVARYRANAAAARANGIDPPLSAMLPLLTPRPRHVPLRPRAACKPKPIRKAERPRRSGRDRPQRHELSLDRVLAEFERLGRVRFEDGFPLRRRDA